ncbi:MAG: hypothetical protein ABIJ40_19695 [Bacteroidota bacterium]
MNNTPRTTIFRWTVAHFTDIYSRNGRYIVREESLIILDTRTGTIYIPSGKKYLELDNFTERN